MHFQSEKGSSLWLSIRDFNFATDIGLTGGTDHLLVKMILGRRFKFGKR